MCVYYTRGREPGRLEIGPTEGYIRGGIDLPIDDFLIPIASRLGYAEMEIDYCFFCFYSMVQGWVIAVVNLRCGN